MAFQHGVRLALHEANHQVVTHSPDQPTQCVSEEIATRISGILSRTSSGEHELFPSNPPSPNASSMVLTQSAITTMQNRQNSQNFTASFFESSLTCNKLMEEAFRYIQGKPPFCRSFTIAHQKAVEAAKSDQPVTLIYLAFFYAVGFNGQPDHQTALRLVERSVQKDITPRSALMLGRMLGTRFGVSRNYFEALSIYMNAKAMGVQISNEPLQKHVSSIFPEEWQLFKAYVPEERAIFS